jgi:hypothetical protein
MRLFAAVMVLFPGCAMAHPVDEVVQSVYLFLGPEVVLLEVDLTPGSAVSGSVMGPLDADGDRRITNVEARDFAAMVLKQSSLMIDGEMLTLTVQSVTVPPYDMLEQAGDTLRIFASAVHADAAGAHVLHYVNGYVPAKSLRDANIFLQPDGAWVYGVTAQDGSDDGSELTVDYTVTRP